MLFIICTNVKNIFNLVLNLVDATTPTSNTIRRNRKDKQQTYAAATPDGLNG